MKLSCLEKNTILDFIRLSLSISHSKIKRDSKINPSILKKLIHPQQVFTIPRNLYNYGQINPCYQGKDIPLIYEDQNFLVFNKPVKVHCHPQTYHCQNNLLSYMRENNYFLDLQVCKHKLDRGLLHRLDYETSGILIYCRSQQLKEEIFKERTKFFKNKLYVAKIEGEISPGLYEHYLVSSTKKILCFDEYKASAKKVCLEVIKQEGSKVYLKLFQGHRHQIRVQLAHLGYPIIGDTLYGGKSAARMNLHASYYQVGENEFRCKEDF